MPKTRPPPSAQVSKNISHFSNFSHVARRIGPLDLSVILVAVAVLLIVLSFVAGPLHTFPWLTAHILFPVAWALFLLGLIIWVIDYAAKRFKEK